MWLPSIEMQRQSDRIESTIRDMAAESTQENINRLANELLNPNDFQPRDMQVVRGVAREEEYAAAIFFDNDARYISDVKEFCLESAFKSVKVDAAEQISEIPFGSNPLRAFIKTIMPNAYVARMKLHGYRGDLYDDAGAFNVAKDGTILTDWIGSISGRRPAAALFDWDQTLSKFGMIDTVALRAVNKEDVLLYLLGGPARLAGIRALFRQLGSAGIDVIILTNNGAAEEKSYLELINTLVPAEVERVFVIYSGKIYYGDPRDRASYGHKGMALSLTPQFESICSGDANTITEGGRRRKRGGRFLPKNKRRQTRRNRRKQRGKSRRKH